MNLFVVGWGLSPDEIRRTSAELRRTAGLYPQLDHGSAWHREPSPGVLFGSVPSPASITGAREYVHAEPDQTIVFDGLPINPAGTYAAHRAEDLGANWENLPDVLEGRFCILRILAEPLEIELITDPLGVEQVYCYEAGRSSILSNSAGLIQRALGLTELDPLGAGLFLGLDWVGGDRTLRRGVTVLPGAQKWTWRSGERSWTKRTYWNLGAAADHPIRIVDRELVDEVVEPLARFCAVAGQVTGSAFAPLTGGRDSRMLAAILMSRDIPVSYWTKGDAGSIDVRIGGEIARIYGLPHRFSNRPTQAAEGRDPTQDVGTQWRTLAETFVAQNDGLASLYNLGNIQGQPDHIKELAVTFTAAGAEAARAPHGTPYLTSPGTSEARISRFLAYMYTARPRGLVRPEAFRSARRHVHDVVRESFARGAAPENLTTMFYLDERCRRYNANNPRELAQTEDKVNPFQTRAYVTSALSMLPRERTLDRLHHEVIKALVPGLEAIPPFDKPTPEDFRLPSSPIRVRNAVMSRLPYPILRTIVASRDGIHPPQVDRTPYSPYDEESWLEMNLDWARGVCLANANSALWTLIDRRSLERLLSGATPPAKRRIFQYPLFAAMTMFEYERVERALGAD